MKDDDYLEDEIYNNSEVNFVIGERPDGDLLFIEDKYPEQFNAMMKELTQWVKRYGIQERKSQLDELYEPSAEWDAERHKAKQAIIDWNNKQIAKAVNKALVLQFEMDLQNLSIHNSLHKLPKEYVVHRKYSLERSIETLKEQKEEL